VTSIAPAPATPAVFVTAATALRTFPWDLAVTAVALPAPRGIAPYSAAIEADFDDGDDAQAGTGRLILLHDPAGNPAWDGDFRLVTFAQAAIDPVTLLEPLRAAASWGWLIDALTGHDAEFAAPSGTVTVTCSTHFGGLEARPISAEIELRGSWTPRLDEGQGLAPHLAAWQDALRLMAGMPPLNDEVVPLAWSAGR
jgi:hypothetical protein